MVLVEKIAITLVGNLYWEQNKIMTIRKLLKELRKHDPSKTMRFIGLDEKPENLGYLYYSSYTDTLVFSSNGNTIITVGELILSLQMYSEGIETRLVQDKGYQGMLCRPLVYRVEGGTTITLFHNIEGFC